MYILLPNGHCSCFVQSKYGIIVVHQTFTYIVNSFRLCYSCMAYFVCYYKLKKMLTLVCDRANSTIQHDWVFLKLAIMMVRTVVISQVLIAYS